MGKNSTIVGGSDRSPAIEQAIEQARSSSTFLNAISTVNSRTCLGDVLGWSRIQFRDSSRDDVLSRGYISSVLAI